MTSPTIGTTTHVRPIRRASSSIRTRLVLLVGAFAFVVLGGLAWLGMAEVSDFVVAKSDERLADAARRSALLVERIVEERRREAMLLAGSPIMVDAARAGNARSRALGLVGQPLARLEERFRDTRSLDADPRVRIFVQAMLQPLGVAEVIVTDEYGHNVVTSELTTDFVQSDEAWWQRAMRAGFWGPEADFDESVRQVVAAVGIAIREPASTQALGALKISFGMAATDKVLAEASAGSGIVVDLIDARGDVVATSAATARMETIPGFAALERAEDVRIVRYDDGAVVQRARMLRANAGRWRVVARQPESAVLAEVRQAQWVIGVAAGVLFVLLFVGLSLISSFIARRISRPAAELAAVSEAVAAGDLSQDFAPSDSDDEIGRLSRATFAMLTELRRLASALGGSSRETSAMANEISVGAEHMASGAQQMATTANDLSQQATEMASSIQDMAGDAGQLVAIAAELDAGAHDGVQRNARLRAMAIENRARLDDSAKALERLAGEVRENAEATASLAVASEEIRTFVTLVQKMARQSKLLALNAAMEAARAGNQGEGFAVVASEVRRLAASSSEAAERTEALVKDVLERMEVSRAASARAAETVQGALEATQQGFSTFGQIEQALVTADGWTTEIERAAAASNNLVNEITKRLDQLSRGTDAFASAMQEVAATSQEQSASTEQIAAAAEKLSTAADHLAKLTAMFQLGAFADAALIPEPAPTPAAPAPAPVRAPESKMTAEERDLIMT
ncbi:MAG TPA: methyl-accepting chemotaxis protein [Gemmatimonadaceae bacterium]